MSHLGLEQLYSEEDNIDDVGDIMMYLLHCIGIKLMEFNTAFGIKDATTNHIPGSDICNDHGIECSSFTKEHMISMTQMVWEFYRCICETACPVNAEALLNYDFGYLLDSPKMKQQTYMVQSMVKIYS